MTKTSKIEAAHPGRTGAQTNTDIKSTELCQARIEVATASGTRRAIALVGGPGELAESKNVRIGKQVIDSAFDTQEVAQVRSFPKQLKWNSEEERKVLTSYSMQKLKAIDSNAPDASIAALVMLTILQRLMPDKAEEMVPVMKTARDKAEQSLRISRASELGDVAHAIKAAQIVGDLGAAADLALERRVLSAARARLHSVEPLVIAKFIGSKLELHEQQRKGDIEVLQSEFDGSLGYRSKMISGGAVLTRGDPSPGFEEISRNIARQRGLYFYTTESGERWRVSASYRVDTDVMISLDREGGAGTVTMRPAGLTTMLKKQTLDQHLFNVAKHAVAESHPEARTALRDHDLTRNGTVYITVTPERYDIVTAASVTYAALLENVLIRRYGKTLEPIHIVSDSPMNQIRDGIRESLNRAPHTKDIFLQLHEHGAPHGLGFSPVITAEDLARLSEEFPKVDLHVMTIACFGGGLRPALQREMEKNPNLKQRLHFYSHTRPEVEAVALGTGGSTRIYDVEMSSTPYMLTLIKKLAEGRATTFGEAVDDADRESQKVAPINPETLLNGEFFGQAKPASQESDERVSV